jgi:GNAT superfamily N-acetyltransferase
MSTQEQKDILKERFAQMQDAQPSRTNTWQPATHYESLPPLIDPSDDELKLAFAANLFDLFRAMSHLPNAKIIEDKNMSRHLSFPFNPMFKGVWKTRLQESDADVAIDDVMAWFKSHDAPFSFWWVDPLATPSNLGERLQAKGWVAWEQNAPGMAADLNDLRYDLMSLTPDGYTQTRVSNEKDLLDFKQAFVSGFDVPEWAGQAWVDATRAFGIERAPWRMYVGRLNGTPVASNMLFNGAGVASVFGVATLPEARGKGIGAAITLIAYEEAKRMGYRHGVLFGTALGVPVYKRIGFREVGVGISRYLWRNG